MNAQQDKSAQMHAKLREGLQILSRPSREEKYKLNAALLKLHSALEDFVRMAVVQKAPHLREQVEDLRQTAWDELIEYGTQYLGFSEIDARVIRDASRQYQYVAHGNNYPGSGEELAEYGAYVEWWCSSSEAAAGDRQPKPEVHVSHASPPAEGSQTPDPGYRDQPWYRSTTFLILTFFLLPPVWALLIITDRNQRGTVTLFAYTVLLLVFLCGIGIVSSSVFFAEPLSRIAAQLQIPLVPTRIPATKVSPAITAASSGPVLVTSIPPTVAAATDSVCAIVWVEHPQDNLAHKSRSWVWEEIVKFKVEGSGMTAREFYDLVVEHNPELDADDYEFMEGKTYLLPECQ